MQPTKHHWSYIPLILIATTLWGSAFAGAKIAFEYMPPLMLSGIRFTLAGILLIPMLFTLKMSLSQAFAEWRFMLLFGFIQSFLQYGLFYMGLNLMQGSIAAIIIGAGPLFVALMAHFSLPNDKLTFRKIAAIVLGLTGVLFISLNGSKFSSGGSNFYLGVALLVASNLIGSYTNIMVVKHKVAISPIVLTLFANLLGGLMLFFFSLFVEPITALTQPLPAEFYYALIWLAIIPAAGFSIWYHLLARPDVVVSELNMWKFVIPIVGVVLSWCLLPDESPSLYAVIGILIISTSILILQFPAKK